MVPFASIGPTVNIDVGAATATIAIGVCEQVRIMNNGTATAWIAFGNSAITAALATAIPIGPGVTEVYGMTSWGTTPLYFAAIAAGATGKIYATPGVGF